MALPFEKGTDHFEDIPPQNGAEALNSTAYFGTSRIGVRGKEMPPTGAQLCIDMSIDLYFYCFIYIYNIFIYFLKESLQKLPSHLAKQRLNNQRRYPGAKYPRGLIEPK